MAPYQPKCTRGPDAMPAPAQVRGGFLFEVISPAETRVSAFIKVDLMMPLIPHWVCLAKRHL